jgi:DNA-binding NarL/FixJ family response regulator
MEESMTNGHSILLVEDHPAWGDLLPIKLKSVESVQFSARANSIQDALTMIKRQMFDLLVVDVKLGNESGLELVQECRQITPDLDCVVLSAFDEDVYLARAWENGAKGYLLKTEEMIVILRALERVIQGDVLWDDYQRLRIQHWRREAGDKWNSLTQREQEVVAALTDYYTDSEIAKALNVSSYTVNNHLKRILEKLELDNRREVSRWAIRYNVMVY